MVASDSTKSSSWEFTQALDLLRSPTYKGTSARSSCPPESPVDLPQDQPKKDVNNGASVQAPGLASKRSHTKLGDFGSLWDLLGGLPTPSVTPATVTTNSKPEDTQRSLEASPAFSILKRPINQASHRNSIESSAPLPSKTSSVDKSKSKTFQDTSARSSKRSPRPQPVTILQRKLGHDSTGTDDKVEFDIPRTPPRTIAGAGNLDTPKARSQHQIARKERQTNISNAAYSSEASAGAESDTSFIFDRPTPKKFRALAFVPTQIGTPDAQASRYDTPPSSFEDQDFALNANAITALGPGNRVQSTIYKSSTERRVSLMTKLLKDFPEYASIVSSVGQSIKKSPRKGVVSESIHIFVDISNVRSILVPFKS